MVLWRKLDVKNTRRFKPVLIAAFLLASESSMAQSKYSFEGFLGGAFNIDSTLSLRQDSEPDIDLGANWETRPFELPPYYSLRLAFHQERTAWASSSLIPIPSCGDRNHPKGIN